MSASSSSDLWRYTLLAAVLSAAGLPIYIHAPKFFVDTYGISLGALGAALFFLRLIDLIQDPAFGWLAQRFPQKSAVFAPAAGAAMAFGMIGLFAFEAPISPLIWFALNLALLFSGYSLLTILFYGQGVERGAALGPKGHVQLAAWRETGALTGVCLAAIAPTLLIAMGGSPFTAYSLGFALAVFCALWLFRREWKTLKVEAQIGFDLPKDSALIRLLWIALLNATPVAITSVLFLFFVESKLDAPVGSDGPLLLLFFLSAALAVPLWARLSNRISPRRTLLSAMLLAILSFLFTLTLQTGDMIAFSFICIATGAAMGADLTLLPALFSKRLAQIEAAPKLAFGLWAFVNKFALAFCAIALLPLLELQGFKPGELNDSAALWTLTLLYAALPCCLKIIAATLLWRTKLEE